MQIEPAVATDAAAISQLIHSVAAYFTLDPDGKGAEGFLLSIGPQAIQSYIEAPNFAYFKACVDGQLAGVVALRDNVHLFHLFVRPVFQRRGLSRLLWQHIRAHAAAAGNPGRYTVNSTPYAVPVYRRFGFQASGEQVETRGIAYVPMLLEAK